MNRKVLKMRKFFALLLLLLPLVACQPTGNTNQDPQAAQSFFPTFDNYAVSGLEGVQDSVLGSLTALGIGTGNLPFSALMYKLDDFVDCYRETGTFDARLYLERLSSVDEVRLPITGVLMVVNQNRAIDNFLPCITRPPSDIARVMSAEPCTGYGTFQSGGDTISYLYAATDQPLCDSWQAHFNTLNR
jgi:hypothetical protein